MNRVGGRAVKIFRRSLYRLLPIKSEHDAETRNGGVLGDVEGGRAASLCMMQLVDLAAV